MFPSKRWSTAAMLRVMAATWIRPLYPAEQALHGSLTVVALLLIWRYTARLQIGNRDFFCMAQEPDRPLHQHAHGLDAQPFRPARALHVRRLLQAGNCFARAAALPGGDGHAGQPVLGDGLHTAR
jgi:hypothetical protein